MEDVGAVHDKYYCLAIVKILGLGLLYCPQPHHFAFHHHCDTKHQSKVSIEQWDTDPT